MLQSISLAQAWPYIVSVFVVYNGVIITFIWRYVDRNDKEHAEINKKNSKQYKELYERTRENEITIARLSAQHDLNHRD